MNKTITFKHVLPKVPVGAFTLAAILSFHTGSVHATMPVIDGPHTASTIGGWLEQLDELERTKNRYSDQVTNLKSNADSLVSQAKSKLTTTNPNDVVTVAMINAAAAATTTVFSDRAKKYIVNDKVCKGWSADMMSVLGSIVNAETPPKKKLEQICVAQRELSALYTEEVKNHYAQMEGYAKAFQEAQGAAKKTTGSVTDSSNVLTGLISQKGVEDTKHQNLLYLITNQQKTLETNQRDIETALMQGTKNGKLAVGVVKTALGAAVGAGLVGGRAVNGDRRIQAYAN
jgi:hypothetical protein